MSNTIAINKTHASSDYTEYIYKLPNVINFTEHDEITFISASLNYSWFNITAKLGNNIFRYKWPSLVANLLLDYSITIDDGYYSITSLNEFLVTNLLYRGHCLKYTASGSTSSVTKIYIEIIPNANYYACQFRVYAFPEYDASSGSFPAGYAVIASKDTLKYPTWTIPANTASNRAPKVNIINDGFKTFTGFDVDLYPSSDYKTFPDPYAKISQNAPMVENISEIFIYCNLIQNIYSTNDSFFYSF